MPYHVGAKGSNGCSGYPALKDTGEVMGCHKTRKEAAGQIYAINRSEGNIGKAAPGVGDFVVFMMEDELKVGRVEFIMDQPGWLGLPDSEYAIETKEGQVGTLVRCYEEEDGVWEEEAELYTIKLSELVRIDSLMVERDIVTEETGGTLSPIQSVEMEMMDKAANPCWDGYVQRGMKEQNGKMVPNCIPVAKANSQEQDQPSQPKESWFNFRDMRPTRNEVRLGE